MLPPYPEHGTYVVTNRPDAVPGQAFDSVHYTVTCSKGYTIIRGKTERICFQGIWSDEIRSCEREYSLLSVQLADQGVSQGTNLGPTFYMI